MVAGELPGYPEVEKSFSLEGVFEWLRDCPEQIERAVIMGAAASRYLRNIGKSINKDFWARSFENAIHQESVNAACKSCSTEP
jgi:hypothetical protein